MDDVQLIGTLCYYVDFNIHFNLTVNMMTVNYLFLIQKLKYMQKIWTEVMNHDIIVMWERKMNT